MAPIVLDPRFKILSIPGVVTHDECAALVAFAERIGFTEAPITTAFGFRMAPEVRDNTRVMVDDPRLASAVWERLAPAIPPRIGSWEAVGLNERFRFYRYEPGQRFLWHHDGSFERRPGEASQLSVLVYLTDDFGGGATEFELDEPLAVRPERGSALVFVHHVCHQGASVTHGRKYVMRSDVMYRRTRSA